jgi:glycine amidinotransferase
MTSPVRSFNEWDPLEEVVVGTVLGAMYPEHSPILAANGEPPWLWHFQGELMEDEYVDGANEQLDALVDVLEGEGVVVRRPDPIPLNLPFETPFWRSRGGWNTANPRDMFLVVGDEIVECASPMRCRYFEALAYRRLFTDYFRAGAKLTAAPRPALRDSLYDHGIPPAPADERDPISGKTLVPHEVHRWPINEDEPVFEAADFVRCGRDLFAQQSVVTNRLGIEWVRRHLGEGFRVHEIQTRCRAPLHIDTTFVPLAPGKALYNPEWVEPERLPKALASWELRPAPVPTYAEGSPLAYPYFSSQWISMNVLSLDEERVLVDAQQTELVALLEGWGFVPIPLAFDYVGLFGGSFHCATLDIRRRGELDEYCS